ncbi:ROK family transcriptional regulator [Robertmurraya sp. DFI.2.37]|uniref:ROK family transcriptional regulator n=1 Tax=Robertmurraya sp. DFI.2.37 TaxID=3031819 RepID=UPI001CD93906|nr:ROK family transcriptional regulator [Robertmurraya sp. DFI.2.37]MDF1507942.1 ROK family transcriptional regulator [Robertmurraya sp. DFI.2.37]
MIRKSPNEQSKLFNKKLVLQCIRTYQPISRAEIAGKLNFSKPTVSILVDELVQENWIHERGIGESSSQGGRRPIQLYFNEKAAYVIGVDIGGTKVKVAISDLSGNIICLRAFNTKKHLEQLMKMLYGEIFDMMEQSQIAEESVLGMGVGVPGIVETETGVVLEAPSLNWIRYPFLTESERYFSFPVYVDNDVNVAVLGEQWLGSAQKKDNVLFIAVGTGIGSGIIIHNQLYRGASYAAGEIGYLVTDKNDMKKEFKPIFHRYGYLESVAGGKAIGEKLTMAIREERNHPLYNDAITSELTGKQAFLLASEGDKIALQIVENALEHLAYGIINAASLLNPEVVILDGGVMKSADFILPRLQKIVQPYLPSSVGIHQSELGENAGVLGAISLFLREYDSILNAPNFC